MEPLYERFVTHYAANIAAGQLRSFRARATFWSAAARKGWRSGCAPTSLKGSRCNCCRRSMPRIISARSSGRTRSASPSPMRRPIARPCAGWAARICAPSWSATARPTSRQPALPAFRSIGVTFGYTSRPVVEFGPDRLVSHFDEIVAGDRRTPRSLTKRAGARYRAVTLVRAISSVGRALCSHRRGHWFESSIAHHVFFEPPRATAVAGETSSLAGAS